IWVTLIIIFVFNQSRPQAVERAESGVAATEALNSETPDASDSSTPPSSTGAVRPPSAEATDPPAEVPHSPDPPLVAAKTELPRATADKPASTPRVSLQTIRDKYGKQPAVRFGLNSNQLENDAYEALNLIARFWNENPETALVLRGYTDSTGVRAYNLKLSEFRADMVKTYLVGRGVEESNIKAFAMGPETPVPDASGTPVDEAQRKVVIEIIPPPE
ncbi:MAG: OmpA family protein, partial [Desulfosarcina sp.]